jgi:hypothetical protein
MAVTRPAVIVQRELAATPAVVGTPVLNALIVGPAYHILDYATDKDEISVGAYGDPASDSDGSQNGRPILGAPVITVADPPANVTGALLDHSSVYVYLDGVLAELATGVDGTKGTVPPDEDLFYTADVNVDFAADGVRPGDRLVVTDDSGASPNTVVKTIQEVGGWAGSTLNAYELRTYSDLNEDDSLLTIGANGAYKWRIERALDDVLVDSSFLDISGNAITIEGGITTAVDVDGDGTDEILPVNSATSSHIQYTSLRQDLSVLAEIESTSQIEELVGRIDERNPLAVGLSVALQNTVTPILYMGVTGDNLNGTSDRLTAYQSAIDSVETRTDIYAIVPLTTDIAVIQAYQIVVTQLALPEKSNFRVVLGSTEDLPLTTEITVDSETGSAETVSGDPVDVFVHDTDGAFSTGGVSEGDILHMPTGAVDDTFEVDGVFDDERLQTKTSLGATSSNSKHYYVIRGEGSALATVLDPRVRTSGGVDYVHSPNEQAANTDYIGQVIRLADARADTSVDYQEFDGKYLVIDSNDGQKASNTTVAPGITFTARQTGQDGDDISIVITTDTAESVTVTDNAIDIHINTGTTDLDGVVSLIEGNTQANGLVTAVVTGVGASPAVPATVENLANGGDVTYSVVGANGFTDQIVKAASLNNAGTSGYNVGDVYELSSGTATAGRTTQVEITSVDAPDGVVTGFKIVDRGDYPLGSEPNLTNSATATVSASGAPTGDFTIDIDDIGENEDHGATVRGVKTASATPAGAPNAEATVVFRQAFRRLLDFQAEFATQTTPVVVSDNVDIPIPPSAGNSDYDTLISQHEVAQVIGDNRLLLALGEDITTDTPDSEDPAVGVPHYRISRDLDRAGQVDELSAIAQSLNSARVVMMWPAEVLVSNVVNAFSGQQNRQPGYYLACAVAGMTAGLPSQQGFTNLTIAGIEKLFNSNFYFSIAQIDELSAAGWYVFIQDTPTSLPFTVHQLTTDPTTLETGEYSLVKNFDFVAQTFKNSLDSFIGRYNVIDETLDLLRDTLRVTGDVLVRARLPRIGAPLRDFNVVSVEESPTSGDTALAVISIDLPKPLNRIELTIQG